MEITNEQTTQVTDNAEINTNTQDNPQDNPADNNENLDGLGSDDQKQDDPANKDNPDQKDDPDNTIYGSPETYDYSEIKLPEGMTLDNEMLNEFNPLAKKFNLSNSSANELMNLAVKLVNKNAVSTVDALKQAQIAEKNSYVQQLNTDTELSAKNSDEYNQYLSVATDGLNAVTTDGFNKFIKEKGLTHHPEFIKVFHKIGLLTQSGKIPSGNPVGDKETAAQILYGGNQG